MWLALLTACTGDPEPATEGPPTPIPGSETVTLTTRDGVDLQADVRPGAGTSGIVLLHMTPVGGWNRTDWPVSFIDKLTEDDHWVLALDRRGAGGSDGDPTDAFEGERGRYDVEAAVLELQSRGVDGFALIGASNGTTSALDYAVWAGSEGLPAIHALGFMTGGDYTENQSSMSDLTAPSVFTYSTAEAAWSVDQQGLDPGSWEFLEYPDGDHGTHMFAAAPEVEDDLRDFFADHL